MVFSETEFEFFKFKETLRDLEEEDLSFFSDPSSLVSFFFVEKQK